MSVAARERNRTPGRLHAFDSLRGSMMLLGLVLHSAMTYVTFPTGDAWPFKDPQTHVAFDLLTTLIHVFRMPVFFVVAGFFGALLYTRRGSRALMRNRLQRIAIPMAVAWCVLLPVVIGASMYGQGQLGILPAVDRQTIPLREIFDHLMHLWFLYHLLIFYALALAAAAALERVPRHRIDRLSPVFGRAIRGSAAPCALALLSVPALLAMQSGGVDNSDSFVPPLRILITYVLFFAFGWLLFDQRDELGWFSERTWRHLVLALGSFGAYLVAATIALTPPGSPTAYPLAMAALAVTSWYWVYGLLGLFLRYFGGESRTARYLADASYWMYLVHLPVTMWVPVWLFHVSVPAELKFLVVFAVTALFALVSYRYWVRSTAIGAVLNGRRYPVRRV